MHNVMYLRDAHTSVLDSLKCSDGVGGLTWWSQDNRISARVWYQTDTADNIFSSIGIGKVFSPTRRFDIDVLLGEHDLQHLLIQDHPSCEMLGYCESANFI